MARTLLSALTAFAIAGQSAAGTIVSLEREGAPVEGEVCRFRAGDRENPIRRWLASQEVICVAAGSSVSFPPGLWNVFGRSGGRWLSSTPLLVDGGAAPAALAIAVNASATLATHLPKGKSGIVYAPRLGTAFPFAADAERIAVPSGEDLWLFVLDRSVPIAIRPIAPLEAGSERKIDAQSGGVPAVIGWLAVPEAERAVLSDEGVSLPHIRLTSNGTDHELAPLPPADVLHGSFVIWRGRGISAGEAMLEVGGKGWLSDRHRIRLEPREVNVVSQPITLRGAATVVVHWSAAWDLREIQSTIRSCNANSRKPLQFDLTLSACATSLPGVDFDPTGCTMLRTKTFDAEATSGDFAIEDVAPGTYLAELRFGDLPPVSAHARVAPLTTGNIQLRAWYQTIYGTLTRGGEPLGEDAVIRFPGGGIGFASAENGEYHAALLQMVATDQQIEIEACDGAAKVVVLPDRDARPHSRFDIDIPDNRLTISVIDTFTRISLPATIRFVAMSRGHPFHPVLTRTYRPNDAVDIDSRGYGDPSKALVIEAVPPREIRLSVTCPGYEKKSVKPFSMTKSEDKEIEVQLYPLRGNTGKLVSPFAFDDGEIFWFRPDGSESEHADIAADGTFIYNGAHEAGETMAIVSRSHPLWVTRAAAAPRREVWRIPFPDAPPRAFDVSIAGAQSAERYIGVVVAGIRIPPQALALHQTLRNLPHFIRGNGPLPIRDIADTGPIDVLLGPAVSAIPRHGRTFDFFALPQYADVPRERLKPGAMEVVLSDR